MFARIKKSGRNEYLQFVENHRDSNKISQRVVATIGRMDKLQKTGTIETLIRSLSRFSAKNLPMLSPGENSSVQTKVKKTDTTEKNLMTKGNVFSEEESHRRKTMNLSLEENAHNFKMIWESSLAGIYVSRHGTFQSVNPFIASFTGYSLKELIGKISDSMIFPGDLEDVKKMPGTC